MIVRSRFFVLLCRLTILAATLTWMITIHTSSDELFGKNELSKNELKCLFFVIEW